MIEKKKEEEEEEEITGTQFHPFDKIADLIKRRK